ncbi:hypothetical protein EGJ22_20440 [Pseudomonas sp. p99-361]|uniref:Uncharacterized protein n=1 Tax=Pseudomonas plecoglossicida TaxID=70775 RepID=A0ABX4TZE6_PSEDL|nr:hypothetical protein CXG44_10395 [Pseudomonas plecoglossicida]PYG98130.1 hypothetical protein CVV67_22835 [Arthrobacter stackebrandtii]RNF68593.1 hypothetical protein EFJ98_19410 [Pseudomonas putida]RRV10037.1 hypothetical protein EGJ22_20440 [Pseudomonas sp. p99-361]PLU92654.1 hypothetical protein CXG45_13250 [Pseudomonas plecoglossicida]
MTRQSCPEPTKTASNSYERKMVRQRPRFLNQETLDKVVREHHAHLIELANRTPEKAGSSRQNWRG